MTSRKEPEHNTDSFLLIERYNVRTGLVFFIISFMVHALLFATLLYLPGFKKPKPMPPVIQIDLVSFSPVPILDDSAPGNPEPDEIDDKADGVPVESRPVPAKKQKISSKKPDISLKTKPKNLKKLMAQKEKKPPKKKEKPKKKEPEKKIEPVKPKQDPEKALAKTKEKLEQKIEDEEQTRIAQALSRLKQKVEHQAAAGQTKKPGDGTGYGRKGSKPLDIYNQIIKYSIEQHWVFNDILAKMDKNLEVIILMKILQSGEIRDIIYETRSGNRYLDESAKKAIVKSNPLPPLPAGMKSYDLGVIFTPEGLK